MRREITVKEIESEIDQYDNIEEPIIVRRADKEDLIIMSIEEYKKKIFLGELEKKLEEGEEDIKNNRVYNARTVLRELGEKYGY